MRTYGGGVGHSYGDGVGRTYSGVPWAVKPPVGTPINFSHPWALGMRAAYVFNEGTGLVAHNSALAGVCDGTANRAMTWTANGPDFLGDITSSATEDYFTCDGVLLSAGQFSILARYTLHSYQPNAAGPDWDCRVIMDMAGNVRPDYDLHSILVYGTSAAAQMNWSHFVAPADRSFLTGDPVSLNVPASIGATYDKANFVLYQDGLPVASDAKTIDARAVARAAVGHFRQGEQEWDPLEWVNRGLWDGTIDYVYVWGRALSAAEVAGITLAPWAVFSPGHTYGHGVGRTYGDGTVRTYGH